jgi:hypothetical protein
MFAGAQQLASHNKPLFAAVIFKIGSQVFAEGHPQSKILLAQLR